MSRFGWAYVNNIITGSATAGGPTNSVQYNSGSGSLTGSSNFTFNPSTNTLTIVGTVSASTYLGVSGSGGATSPAGSNKYLQYNSGSAFGASPNLIFDYTVNELILTGNVKVIGQISASTAITSSVGRFDTIILSRTNTSSSISLNSSQHIIAIDTLNALGSVTLSLPNASTLPSGKHYVIKDEGGNANNRNIILSCSVSGQKIDGSSTLTITSPYASVNVYCDGTSKYFIY